MMKCSRDDADETMVRIVELSGAEARESHFRFDPAIIQIALAVACLTTAT